jgi:hypothetical protein
MDEIRLYEIRLYIIILNAITLDEIILYEIRLCIIILDCINCVYTIIFYNRISYNLKVSSVVESNSPQ